MKRYDGELVFSATDLNGFLHCTYLTGLDLERVEGHREAPAVRDPNAELAARKGDEWEARYLAGLRAQGRDVVEIARPAGSREAVIHAAQETVAAMRAGREIIYQAVLFDGTWRGYVDVLERQGPGHYEVLDTKLARSLKPYFLVQLATYSDLLGRVQAVAPTHFTVVLGNGERHRLAVDEAGPYTRRLRRRFLERVAAGPQVAGVVPDVVGHCGVCDWAPHCDELRARADHLSQVARLRTDQAKRLREAGLPTMDALASAAPGADVPGMLDETFATLRRQAQLQVHERRTGEQRAEAIVPQTHDRGFALLVADDPGDLFFDFEGDPFWGSDGLEYLWGWEERAGDAADGPWTFRRLWAHDDDEERVALEAFLDHVVARRARHPKLHVFHYAPYEVVRLKALVARHGTREDSLDELLRAGVFVDLYAVVRGGVRVSKARYGLKAIEPFFMEPRQADLKDAAGSIVDYERWLETRDQAILDGIEAYNAEDCTSTRLLLGWLRERALEAGPIPVVPDEPPRTRAQDDARAVRERRRTALRARLGVAHPMSDLVEYHWRERRPAAQMNFVRRGLDPEDLVRDGECVGGLRPDPQRAAFADKQSMVHPMRFLVQETKLRRGDTVTDTETGRVCAALHAIDAIAGTLELRRGPKLAEVDLPRALGPGWPFSQDAQEDALLDLGESIAEGTVAFGALEGILERRRIAAEPYQADDAPTEAEALRAVRSLAGGHLVVQGPPGTGKTWTAGRMVVALLCDGKRVGVASQTHAAINNVLREVLLVAREQGVEVRGLKKGSTEQGIFDDGLPDSDAPDDFLDEELNLIAGTGYLFAREDLRGHVDTLVIDEAGQVSLADALAMGTAARNVVLVGDQQQLAQVSQAVHPRGAGCSVLEHLLQGADVVDRCDGLFLGVTRRMRPRITQFVSRLAYDGRLTHDPCVLERTIPGVGELRFEAVAHEGRSTASPEEAARVAEVVGELVGRAYRDGDEERALRGDDVLIVAPYNAHVAAIVEALEHAGISVGDGGVKVGTVDKFQGQEAPVALYSMASSSGDDVPRGLGFLFSRHRLNVALSRAQCLAVLVTSTRLLDAHARRVEELRLVNEACRFAEAASV